MVALWGGLRVFDMSVYHVLIAGGGGSNQERCEKRGYTHENTAMMESSDCYVVSVSHVWGVNCLRPKKYVSSSNRWCEPGNLPQWVFGTGPAETERFFVICH